MARLTIGLHKGQIVVYLPGARHSGERFVPLARGREADMLLSILRAQDAGERGIETKAEPTMALAFHLSHHTKTQVDTCPHCVAERAALEGATIKRYGKRGGLLSSKKKLTPMEELNRMFGTLPKDMQLQLLHDMMEKIK